MDRKILIFFAVVVGMGLGGHLIYGQKSQYFRSEVPEKRFALPQPNSQSATQLTPPPQASSGGATVLLDDKATGAKLSVGGVGHARYVFAKEGDSYPMTRALDSEFTFKAQPNKHLTVDFRAQLIRTNMDAQPPSANTFVPRMALSWVNEIADPELTQSITRVGDLRRLTLGKGLFFKDLESEGITTELKGRTQSITGTYVSRAYTEKSDLGILDWANANRTSGLYVAMIINDRAPFSSTQALLGGYGNSDIFGLFSLDWEGAISGGGQLQEPGYAVLIAPKREFKGPDYYFSVGLSGRGYYGKTNRDYRTALTSHEDRFVMPVRSLMDEELDYDNWRNVLLNVDDAEGAAQSLALHIRSEQAIAGPIWVYFDGEVMQIWSKSSSFRQYLGSAGFKFSFSQNHFAYIAVQNKFLTPVTADFETVGVPVVSRYSPVITAGVKYKF